MPSRPSVLLPMLLVAACATEPVDIRPLDTLPRYLVFRRGEPIVIDARLDDAGWSHLDSMDLPLGAARVTARVTFDDEALYLAIWSEGEPLGVTVEIDANNDGERSQLVTGELSQTEQGSVAELLIPMSAITDAPHRPPQAGELWTMTLVRADAPDVAARCRLEFAARVAP